MAAVTITVLRLVSLALVKLNYMRETPRTAAWYSLKTFEQSKSKQTWGQSAGKTPTEVNDMGEPSETSRSASSVHLDAQWVVGFVDGEGCFFIGINPHPEMSAGYQVLPEFTVVQHQRDVQLLHRLKQFFGCGVVRVNHGDRMCYRVRDSQHLRERIIPFFEKHPLKTRKRIDFAKFRRVVRMMGAGEHLTREGVEEIRRIASQMNRKAEKIKSGLSGNSQE